MQQTSGHTLKAFDEDIERLRAMISQMGGLAEHAIGEAMRCLIQRDTDGALRSSKTTASSMRSKSKPSAGRCS